MKKTQLHVGMKVGYTGDLRTHPADGGVFEGIVTEIRRKNAVVESLKRTMRGNGRKWYKAGQLWSLPIDSLTPLIEANAPTKDEGSLPPTENTEEALQRILALVEGASSPTEEMVYLRELHRLIKLSSQPETEVEVAKDEPSDDEFPAHLMTEGQALQWARNRKCTLNSHLLTVRERREAIALLDANIERRIKGFTGEELRKIFNQLESACRGDSEFKCDPARALKLIARSGREHTDTGYTRLKKHVYTSAWGAKYTLGHKNVRGGEPCFRRTTESELYTVAFMILELGRPLTKGDVENVELSPNSRIDARIKKTCI
tara:strand:+ start:1556 stop:2506 length:951 start_codon:yes stop_codon:yes gene_type:complete